MSITIRNLRENTVVFSKPGLSTIIWKAKGDPVGDDVKQVPDLLAEDADFLASYSTGMFEILESTNAPLVDQLVKGAEAIAARRGPAQPSTDPTAAITRRRDNDVLSFSCLGPGPNGRGACGNQVLIAAKDKAAVPPLCTIHKTLAPEFAYTTTGSLGDGASSSARDAVREEWKRVTG